MKGIRFFIFLFLFPLLLISASELCGGNLDREALRYVRIIDYDWQVRIDFETQTYKSQCGLTVWNESDKEIRTIPFLLYRLLRVDSVTGETGQAVEFTQAVTVKEDEENFQLNLVTLVPEAAIRPGEKKRFRFTYGGYMLGYRELMQYTRDSIDQKYTILRMDCYAYPVLSYPSWKEERLRGFDSFDYRIEVTVPDSYVVANGGRLVSREEKNGEVTYIYKNTKKSWRMDIAVARYKILADDVSKLRVYCFQEDTANASAVMEEMKSCLSLLSEWFGPLKEFRGFSLIQIPEGYGSQTDVTSILQDGSVFRDEKRAPQLYHEIAHFWNPPCNDPLPPRWMSEGYAMFTQSLVWDALKKTGNLEAEMERLRSVFLKRANAAPGALTIPVIDYGRKSLTDFSYTKGAWLFYVLYHLMGKEDFNRLIGSVYDQYNDTGITSEQYVALAKKISKRDLDPFFRDWLFTAESSKYLQDNLSLREILKKYE